MIKRFIAHTFTTLAGIALAFTGFASVKAGGPNVQYQLAFSSDQPKVGSEIKVTVNAVMTEVTAGGVQFDLSYDTGKLTYLRSDIEGVGFTLIEDFPKHSNGKLSTMAYSKGRTGQAKVIGFTFKTKATGTAAFNFSNVIASESGTGQSISASGVNRTLTIGGTAVATPKPATPKPTATPTITSTPVATPTPTVTKIDANQSTVVFNKTSATADGVDTITASVTLRNSVGTLVTDVTPEITGYRNFVDVPSPFALDSTTQTWASQITSTQEGLISVDVWADGVLVGSQDLTFTAPGSGTNNASTTGGKSSFGLMIMIGGIVLLLLLAVLYFVWRKLKDRGQEEDMIDMNDVPAYPGDTSGSAVAAAAVAPAPTPGEENNDTAAFNPAQTLQRTNQAPPAPPANDDSIEI